MPQRASAASALKVLIVDDQQLMRDELRTLLETEQDITIVGDAPDGAAAVDAAQRLHPDVILMDIRMPRMDGVEAVRAGARGLSNKEIAGELYLAEGTVKNHVSTILAKIGARDRTQAALAARKLGHLDE
jgi:DNA-binding NarL/FixJ family response regulator